MSDFTKVVNTMFLALNVVSRELVGFIPSTNRDSGIEMAELNKDVDVPIVGAATASDITPGVTPPAGGDETPETVKVKISASKKVPIKWTGEETMGTVRSGTYDNVNMQRVAQALRTLANGVEGVVAGLHVNASRAYGTPGTAPFGTAGDMSDFSQPIKILDDNGAPGDRHLTLGTTAVASLRAKQSNLFKANEAGSNMLLRTGIIEPIYNTGVWTSGQVATHVAGDAAGATTDATGYAVGTKTIALAAAGTGEIKAGDVITFAGDTNKYVVGTGDADVSGGGSIVLNAPGLRVAIPAAATAITVLASSERNMIYSRSAIALATRIPALPKEGDMASKATIITDPVSGLSFRLAEYKGYHQTTYHIEIAYGANMIKSEHTGLLLG